MKAFLLLIRPLNLLIIAATMYAIRLFIFVYEQAYQVELLRKNGEEFEFFLLVFSTVLIAAAGNAINDYFDVKADRINRPDKLIIGKHLKRRWAIIGHWTLNLIAFLIAVFLSYSNHTFWYVFIHLVSINSLWLYSLYFKKKALVGNFIIAGLTALVPILCGVHFYIQKSLIWSSGESDTAFSYWLQALLEDGHFILLLAFFAFVNNFAREIIKDIEDVPGDQEIKANTLPIVYGQRISKFWILTFLALPVVFFTALFLFHDGKNQFGLVEQLTVFLPVILSLLADAIAGLLVIKSQTRLQFVRADQWVKTAMILGILTPIYWYMLWI